MNTCYVGCDIASRWFDVCVLMSNERKECRFENNAQGCTDCLNWLRTLEGEKYIFGFEPTGRYGELLTEFLSQNADFVVLQANPRKFRQYAKSLDPDTKSDQFDSFALAMYMKERPDHCRSYAPKSEPRRELSDLQMHLRSLEKRKSALKNQLGCGLRSSFVRESIERQLLTIEAEYEEACKQCLRVIEADVQLATDCELLQSIPGVGERTAVMLLTAIDFRQLETGRAVARFLGLTQRKHESGTSVRGKPRITKAGDPHVRAGLYFPSISAMRHEPSLADFAARLKAKGKPWQLIRTAVARKLVVLAAALIREQRFYTPLA